MEASCQLGKGGNEGDAHGIDVVACGGMCLNHALGDVEHEEGDAAQGVREALARHWRTAFGERKKRPAEGESGARRGAKRPCTGKGEEEEGEKENREGDENVEAASAKKGGLPPAANRTGAGRKGPATRARKKQPRKRGGDEAEEDEESHEDEGGDDGEGEAASSGELPGGEGGGDEAEEDEESQEDQSGDELESEEEADSSGESPGGEAGEDEEEDQEEGSSQRTGPPRGAKKARQQRAGKGAANDPEATLRRLQKQVGLPGVAALAA